MRRIMISKYIYQLKNWPDFKWNQETIIPKLIAVRHKQGLLLGKMGNLGFMIKEEAVLSTLTLDVLKSSEIEGEILNPDQVRSSIARRLGMDIAGLVPSDRNVEGVVEMVLDATQNFESTLTQERLFAWHASLFPTGRSGMYTINVGNWRNGSNGPMQVVSGAIGFEKVHFEAPAAEVISDEMQLFFKWFNESNEIDPVIKAAISHLWFVTIHPFEDGNGRIARAITDMQLTRADGITQRFYSMSAQIRVERKAYYEILEQTQKGSLDITKWIYWFLDCLDRALQETDNTLSKVLEKTHFWNSHVSAPLNERQRSMINKMLDGFEGKVTTSKWANITKCSHDSALRDIQDLINKNIIHKDASGGRSTSYLLNINNV